MKQIYLKFFMLRNREKIDFLALLVCYCYFMRSAYPGSWSDYYWW